MGAPIPAKAVEKVLEKIAAVPTTAIEMGTNPVLKNSAAVDDVDVGVGVTDTKTEICTNPMLKNSAVPASVGQLTYARRQAAEL